ncbi:hypothetical protein [Aeromonas phage L9-6]|nr:hypothetical protein [Aeromonas phage L9-6]
MEFKIIVKSSAKGPVDQYIANLKNAGRVGPGESEMHILRNFEGVDIVFHAEGYNHDLYAELKRHVCYIVNTVKTPTGASVIGWF